MREYRFKYPFIIRPSSWRTPKEDYCAEVPALNGCFAHGDSIEETLCNLEKAIQAWKEGRQDYLSPIPHFITLHGPYLLVYLTCPTFPVGEVVVEEQVLCGMGRGKIVQVGTDCSPHAQEGEYVEFHMEGAVKITQQNDLYLIIQEKKVVTKVKVINE